MTCFPLQIFNTSCRDIYNQFPSASSGYYQILVGTGGWTRVANGSVVQVLWHGWCKLWRNRWLDRVAYVNMSQAGATCPVGLTQMTLSGLTLCGRDSDTGSCSWHIVLYLGALAILVQHVNWQLRGSPIALPHKMGMLHSKLNHLYYKGKLLDDHHLDKVHKHTLRGEFP